MNFFRRDFLRLSLFSAFASTLGRQAKAERAPQIKARTGLSILQGATDDSSTQFSIVHVKSQTPVVVVEDAANRTYLPDKMETKVFTGSSYYVTRVFFSGLKPNQDYVLDVKEKTDGSVLDLRIFQTLDLAKAEVSFALCSCMDDSNHEPEIWQDLVAKRPDVIFFIGDSVYSDKEKLHAVVPVERLWRRFSEARRTLEIYYSQRLIPVIATWDDHDFAGNDSDSSYKYVKESQQNFLTYFAQEPEYCSVLTRGPGVSSAITLAGQLFILMDDRSFRLRAGSSERYAQWGQAQEEWALALIRDHQGPTWFFNGTQLFPQMFFKESVSGDHKVQFDAVMSALAKINSKVVFGSGDVHFSEISQIEKEVTGYSTYELTSSAIHSSHIPGVPEIVPNHRRIYGTSNKNYLLVQAKAMGTGVQMTVASHSKRKEVNFIAKFST